MFNLVLIFLAAALAGSPAPSSPSSPPPPPSDMGGGGGGGRHGGGHEEGGRGGGRDGGERLMKRLDAVASELGLTTEQKTSLDKIYYDSRSAGIDLEAKSEKAKLELERLMMADTFDEKGILKAFDAAAVAESAERKNDLMLMVSVRKTLTAEQWTKLKSIREERRDERREERREERRSE